MVEPGTAAGRADDEIEDRLPAVAAPFRLSDELIEIGYTARAKAYWVARGVARALQPIIGRSAFDTIYGLGRVGYLPRIGNPSTLVEKLLWLKRHYRHPLMPTLVDKLAVRDYVRAAAPDLRITEVYTASDSVDGFDFDALPDRAVIKPSHASGLVTFWQPGVDRAQIRDQLHGWLGARHDRHLAEWFYASLVPQVFAEQDLRDAKGSPPLDYKVLVLNGRAQGVQVFAGRGSGLARTTFDREWRLVPSWRSREPGGRPVVVEERDRTPRPERLDDMLAIAERLAAPFPFARIDLYAIGSELYFSEITFMPSGGYLSLGRPYDREFGAMLTLPPITPGAAP